MTSAVILGMIVTMFPEPRRAGEGDRRLRASSPPPAARSACSPAACSPSRSTGTGSSSSTSRSASPPRVLAHAAARARRGHRPRRGRRHPRRGADHQRADARRLHDRQARRRARLGLWPRRSASARCRWRCSPAFIAREATARNPLVPLRIFRSRNVVGRQHGAGAHGGRHVRHVLPRRALPAAGARLRRAPDRPRVPARPRSSWA